MYDITFRSDMTTYEDLPFDLWCPYCLNETSDHFHCRDADQVAPTELTLMGRMER